MIDVKQYNYSWLTYAGEPANRSGCGFCSVADFLDDIPPEEVARWLDGNGWTEQGHGTIWGGIPACLNFYGVGASLIASGLLGRVEDLNFEIWKSHIRGGGCGILLMGAGVSNYWTNGGHYIAIVDYDSSRDLFKVFDPASDARTGWHSWGDFAGNIKNVYTVDRSWNSGKLEIDGFWGHNTIKALQRFFGLKEDGVISKQCQYMRERLQNCPVGPWEFVNDITAINSGGSNTIMHLQKFTGAAVDGLFGENSLKALQKFLRVKVDGFCGPKTVKALQRFLNNYV